MANGQDHRPLSELVTGLVGDISGLFRKEIDLAKAEASQKISHAVGGLEVFAIGLVLAIGAVGVLLSAIVNGLTAMLVAQGFTEPNASALSSVIVAIVVGLVAWVMISKGIGVLRNSNLSMSRTANSLRRDADMVKERMS